MCWLPSASTASHTALGGGPRAFRVQRISHAPECAWPSGADLCILRGQACCELDVHVECIVVIRLVFCMNASGCNMRVCGSSGDAVREKSHPAVWGH
eukprot:3069083-Prymnesium_polylepis.3